MLKPRVVPNLLCFCFFYRRVGRSCLVLRFHLRQRRFEQLLRRGKEHGVQRAVAYAVGSPLELSTGREKGDEMRPRTVAARHRRTAPFVHDVVHFSSDNDDAVLGTFIAEHLGEVGLSRSATNDGTGGEGRTIGIRFGWKRLRIERDPGEVRVEIGTGWERLRIERGPEQATHGTGGAEWPEGTVMSAGIVRVRKKDTVEQAGKGAPAEVDLIALAAFGGDARLAALL
jgi:hypothetical protein